MGKRATGRKLAFQALYQAGIRKADIETVISAYLESAPYHKETVDRAVQLARATWQHLSACNELIQRYAKDWDITRIMVLDRAILQIAFYELIYEKTAPTIVINEALELAKKYSTEDSPKFINGILGQFIKDQKKL